MSFIEISNLTKTYEKFNALNNLNMRLEEKKQYAIKGASGSGKSTMLYLLGGLDQPSSGNIQVGDLNLAKLSDKELANYRNSYVGFIFQFHFLLPSMSSMQNILLPAKIGGASDTKQIKERCISLADDLGVSHCLNKYPYQLSGGEQQRVNIIRAISLKPKLLLCDEPTGNLDSVNSDNVTNTLKQVAEEFNSTLIVVTHDDTVSSKFNDVLTMKDGQLI